MVEHGGNIAPFNSFEYHQLTSGLTKRSKHVPLRAAPLTREHIRMIVQFLDQTPAIPLSAKPCLLITLSSGLGIFCHRPCPDGVELILSVLDISLTDEGLRVSVRSTTTKSDPTPVCALIPWQANPLMCPAMAWHRYQQHIKPWILGPAFLTESGLPLTPRHLVGFMQIALRDAKDIDPAHVSMHSLGLAPYIS